MLNLNKKNSVVNEKDVYCWSNKKSSFYKNSYAHNFSDMWAAWNIKSIFVINYSYLVHIASCSPNYIFRDVGRSENKGGGSNSKPWDSFTSIHTDWIWIWMTKIPGSTSDNHFILIIQKSRIKIQTQTKKSQICSNLL